MTSYLGAEGYAPSPPRISGEKVILQDRISGEYVLMTCLDKRTKRRDLAWIGNLTMAKNLLKAHPQHKSMAVLKAASI